MMDDFEKESKVYKKALKAALSGFVFYTSTVNHQPLAIIHHPCAKRIKKPRPMTGLFSFRL